MAPEVEAELGDDDQDDGINASCLEKEPHPNPFPPAEKAIGTTPTRSHPGRKTPQAVVPSFLMNLKRLSGVKGGKVSPRLTMIFDDIALIHTCMSNLR